MTDVGVDVRLVVPTIGQNMSTWWRRPIRVLLALHVKIYRYTPGFVPRQERHGRQEVAYWAAPTWTTGRSSRTTDAPCSSITCPAVEDLLEDMDRMVAQSAPYTLAEWNPAVLVAQKCAPLCCDWWLSGSDAAALISALGGPHVPQLTPQEAWSVASSKKLCKGSTDLHCRRQAVMELIAPGDRIAVCISGGKDSHGALAKLILQELQRHTEQPCAGFLLMDRATLAGQPGADRGRQRPPGHPITVFRSAHFRRCLSGGEEPLLLMRPDAPGLFCTARLRSWGATRSPWGTISRRAGDHAAGPVFTVPSSRPCPQAPQQKFPRHGIDPSAVLCP